MLFLFGLYISSLSSCLGAQYAAPRIIQCISRDNVIPLVRPLGKGVSLVCIFIFLFSFISVVVNLNFFCQYRPIRKIAAI